MGTPEMKNTFEYHRKRGLLRVAEMGVEKEKVVKNGD